MNTDEYGISPLDMARLVEDSGLESLWLPDHSHVPVGGALAAQNKVKYGGGEEREERFKVSPGHLPREYYRNYDQLTTIAAMGAVTSTLKLGTGICLVVQREPLYLAKQLATIDHFTNGRLIFGVGAGAGWNRGELENHGVVLKTRTDVMLERIDAMKQIWSEDQAEFHGEHVDFDPIFSWPKPISKPYPQILMGGMGPSVLDRVLSHADGWFPGHTDNNFDELGDRITELRERAANQGRTVGVSINFGRLEFIEQYAAMKPDRVVFMIPALISGVEKRKFIQELGALAPQLAESAATVA
ncbi:TIGR03619 family F420-dependent LLM class oxidoreductase [Rhodococcus qingshengii]|uniref:TIGR03619 family F420-dependent LLM class oxidoreductase n=1 Tax=Rhodococcus qingshengii TaxID=334542 RepID=UPI001455E174|nr:TIGR03619 family F420-dependent LLM class oxidoreductase [Rhodococcus qingshengii]